MKVYSESIHLFALRCEDYLKDIITKETSFKLRRSRFEYNNYTYPIHVVIFEQQSKLGYFDSHTYQIGLNLELMYSVKENVLKDILRHELAHYITYLKYPEQRLDHGENFKKICLEHSWDQSISKASMNVELANAEKVGNLASEKLIGKIKALLHLAESDNKHEAELATLKANQLLLKHNLKHYNFDHSETKTYSKNLLIAKRKNAKLACVYEILKHFMVRPVLIYGKGQVALEVSGSYESLELAEYVTQFLDRELEQMWNQNKSEKVKGLKAKNSFFHGIARGYNDKMQKTKSELKADEQKALIIIEKDLDDLMGKIYRRLSHTSSQSSFDRNAYESGKAAGKNLNINRSVKNNNSLTKFLPWSQK